MHKTPHATGVPRRMIGVSLGFESTAESRAALHEAARLADVVELRLDLMAEYDLPRLLDDRPCPVVVTNRPEREGGRFRGTERERLKPLLESIDLGVDYVDIEHDAVHLIQDRKQTRLMVSHHDFQTMPGNLANIYADLAAKGADVVKVVGMAGSVLDNLPVLDTLAHADRPTVAIAMGEAGLISRVLALRYDTCLLTYSTQGDGETIAPGQLPISTMRDVYHTERIGLRTAVYGVLSSQSVSDGLLSSLNAAMGEAGLDGVWVPFVASSGRASPADVLRAFRSIDVAGYVVAESAQGDVRAALDDVESVGPNDVVNVVMAHNGRLVGRWARDLKEAFSQITGREVAIEA